MRVIDFFDRGAMISPERACVTDGVRSLTYRQAQEITHRIANGLEGRGIERGDGVAILSPNDIFAYICGLGLNRAGALWIPLNARNSLDDNIWHMQMGQSRLLFYHSDFADKLDRIRSEVSTLTGFVCIDREDQYPSLERFCAAASSDPVPPPKVHDPQETFRITMTGGTTGRPKGVMQTHQMAETNLASFLATMKYDGPPTYLCAAPMTHAAGVTGFHALALGGTVMILPKPDAGIVLETIQKHRINSLLVPSTVLYLMLAHPKVREYDYSSLRYFFFGTSPTSVEKLREAIDVFGPMAQIFGQTEASLMITFFSPQEYAEARKDPSKQHRLASCGRAGPLCTVAIMSDDGRLLPDGERGEIVLRSGLVMKGYLNDPENTAKVSTYGWHHTGDIGFRDEDGYIYIVDRKRDLIISGGFNVFPSEVEQVIWSHPAVQDCAVIGVPHEKWGEEVKAVIELKPGATTSAEDIIALCKAKLGSVKAPKTVEFWPQLPRSSVGKVLKREVREVFWEGKDRTI